jgi:hypothetical protein
MIIKSSVLVIIPRKGPEMALVVCLMCVGCFVGFFLVVFFTCPRLIILYQLRDGFFCFFFTMTGGLIFLSLNNKTMKNVRVFSPHLNGVKVYQYTTVLLSHKCLMFSYKIENIFPDIPDPLLIYLECKISLFEFFYCVTAILFGLLSIEHFPEFTSSSVVFTKEKSVSRHAHSVITVVNKDTETKGFKCELLWGLKKELSAERRLEEALQNFQQPIYPPTAMLPDTFIISVHTKRTTRHKLVWCSRKSKKCGLNVTLGCR